MITTTTIADFISTFYKRNPQVLETLFGASDMDDQELAELAQAQSDAETAAQWRKLENGYGPPEGEFDDEPSYMIMKDGVKLNPYAESTTRIKGTQVARVHVWGNFKVEGLDQLVLELKDGTYVMGQFCGQ